MDIELAYKVLNGIILIPWLCMIIIPRSKITDWLIKTSSFSILMAVVYLFCFIVFFGTGDGGMGSIKDLSTAFQVPGIVLLAWVHYLSFDLFVGGWIFLDAKAKNINHFVLIPCLIFSLMAGPVGLLIYWLVCKLFKKGWM